MRALGLVAALAAISALHYSTSPIHIIEHEIYRYLYYAPIIVGAYWYGVGGGLLTAVLASLAYLPHIRVAWAPNVPYTVNLYAQLMVFHLLGLSVGLLASFQRKLTDRYREAAASLERANRELRESHEQLRRADRLSALGEVAAGLAHEIRNPLASVKGALEILAARAHGGSPEAEFADIAGRDLARIDRLVSEFLAYARPRQPERRVSDLHQTIEHVIALLRPEAQRAGVMIENERRTPLPSLSIDTEQIEQVLFNVVLNAVQASSKGKRVRIQEGIDGDNAVIDVIDEGPGIAPEHAGRIFDPFFTTKARGTGLGLAISQRIVAAHAGTIEALPGPTAGTDIRIRLPLSAAAPEAASRLVAKAPV
jgi:signal transduction histidine kinase